MSRGRKPWIARSSELAEESAAAPARPQSPRGIYPFVMSLRWMFRIYRNGRDRRRLKTLRRIARALGRHGGWSK